MEIGSKHWADLIRTGAQAFGLELDREQLQKMAAHANLVLSFHSRMNLTSITKPDEMAVRHYVDSLAPLQYMNHAPKKNGGKKVLDIGTGAGFPGIPMKIACPCLDVTLLDSRQKKVSFLNHAIRSLGLEDIRAVRGRAEDMAEDAAFSFSYDYVVARAFSSLDRVVSLGIPFLAKGGVLLAMKSKEGENEVSSLEKRTETWGYSDKNVEIRSYAYLLPHEKAKRLIVALHKTGY